MSVAVGLSLRPSWTPALLDGPRGAVDVLEVLIDEGIHAARPCPETARAWRELSRRWPLIAHGTELGIGGAEGVDAAYLDAVAELCRAGRLRWYTEHLAFTRAGGVELGHFVALEASPEQLAALRANAAELRRRVGRPLLLENPADVLGLGPAGPAGGRERGRAYADALRASGAGALLDLTNLLYDARNSRRDDGGAWTAESFLDALDWERVVEVHLAGGVEHEGLWIDTHSRPVEAEAHALLLEVLRRAPNLAAVVIEWDSELPELDGALAEVEAARALVAEVRGGDARPSPAGRGLGRRLGALLGGPWRGR